MKKCVVIGVTGGIAVYNQCFKKEGYRCKGYNDRIGNEVCKPNNFPIFEQ